MWLEIFANPSPKAKISNPSTARNAVSTERSTWAAVSGRVFLFLWLVSHSMPIYSRLKQILIHIEQYYFNENFINTDWFIIDLDEKVIKVDQKSIELNWIVNGSKRIIIGFDWNSFNFRRKSNDSDQFWLATNWLYIRAESFPLECLVMIYK